MSKFLKGVSAAALLGLMAAPGVAQDGASDQPAGHFGLGRAATPDELAAWDVDVSPDGTGLPEGSGSVMDGETLFIEKCAVCHGEFAEGAGNWPKLAGGEGTLADDDPVKTIGSYWPYLSTAWDYVHRSMPYGNAQTLSADETYAIVAYILYSNFLVDDDFVLTKDNFLEVEMTNADNFIVDDREVAEAHFWKAAPCMENCKESVEITKRATTLNVTPVDEVSGVASEVVAEDAPAPDAAPEEAPAMADAPDPALVAAGAKVFKKCQACHQVGDGAKNRVGPILSGVVGRRAASVEGFRYSKPMTARGADGLVWSDDILHEYLANPRKFVKGTSMGFAGLKAPEDIDAVIAYIQSESP